MFTNTLFFLLITSTFSCNQYLNYKNDSDTNAIWSYLSHFNSFAELTSCKPNKFNITKHLAICPKRKLLVDESLNLTEFLYPAQFFHLNILHVQNLIGVDLNADSLQDKMFEGWTYTNKIIFNIYLSRFDVYSNGSQIDQTTRCDKSMSSLFISVFGALNFYSVVYPKVWCPHFFSLSMASRLIFQDITNR